MIKRIQAILKHPHIKRLYEYYVQREVHYGKTFSSPLRQKDKHPSFNIYEDQKIKFKDFAGESGDIIDFVMIKFKLSKADAIAKIENDLKIPKLNIEIKKKPLIQISENESNVIIRVIKDKPFEKDEIAWCKQFKINKNTVELYRFKCAEEIHIITKKRTSRFITWPGDPLFYLDYPSGNKKVYRPLAKKQFKWRCNTNNKDIFGYWLLKDKEEAIIIASGPKDCMSLYSNTGIVSICLSSETAYMSTETYYDLRERTENLFILFDNDEAGIKATNRWKERYLVKDLRMFLPKEYKDVALYYQALQGEDILNQKIKQLIHGTKN